MEEWIITQAAFLLRIMVAAVCGALIGYERQNRLKNAGVRTHLIVSIASALMMIISKYGFSDILGNTGVGLDPSRIAAGVVTAIGFLGAGIIFVHKQTVSGVTTAAGIWATVGIGMAIGAGMYLLGVVTALLIILLQLLFHKLRFKLKTPMMEKIVLRVKPGKSHLPEYLAKLKDREIEVLETSINRKSDGTVEIKLTVRFPDTYNIGDALQVLLDDPAIQSVNM